MKKYLLTMLVLSTLFIFMGCSDKEINDDDENMQIKQFSNLPIKKELSYFFSPKNFVGMELRRLYKTPLSAYEKGRYSSAADSIKKRFSSAYHINSYDLLLTPVTVRLDTSNVGEFDKDELINKLKESFYKKTQQLKNNILKVDKHIRIININIPVTYSKLDKKESVVKIINPKILKSFSYTKTMNLYDFVNEALNDDLISKYVVNDGKEYNFNLSIQYPDNGLKILGNSTVLNNIGKKNKGKDNIVELTLLATSGNGDEIIFMITSFKVASSNKRFVTSYYINRLLTPEYKNNFFVRDNNVEMFNKKD